MALLHTLQAAAAAVASVAAERRAKDERRGARADNVASENAGRVANPRAQPNNAAYLENTPPHEKSSFLVVIFSLETSRHLHYHYFHLTFIYIYIIK